VVLKKKIKNNLKLRAMPHFIIDCAENIIKVVKPETIMQTVYEAAAVSTLFDLWDIKVRINPFQYYTVGNQKEDFIHVFGNMMEGRTTEQKSRLSKEIIRKLKLLFPDVPVISMNIRDFEKASYCNKSMV
jgi:5-carboxymethyl-2-hydroxymuconate isomerase